MLAEDVIAASDLLSAPLDDLLAEARRLRAGPLVTYSPKVFIPLTTLCRDVCGYCTFARPPRRGERAFMTEDEVLEIARAGAAAGCREALFTLGDKPELRYEVARRELRTLGCETTLEYLARCARLVLEETGLLPHLNPGVMTRGELEGLRPVSASMGIMLETTADRLGERGGPHWASPDKIPARRLETIRLAGELAIPFTSGILIGIGETRAERIDALLALRALGEEHGHVQEVIVQNFRAKPGTRMASHPEPSLDEHLWTIAVARILLGPAWHVQAPPNLAYDDFPRLLDAGIDDWGGVSPVTIDHVNPEAPWPEIERLEEATRGRGLELAPRLAIYPEYVAELERWVDPAVAPYVRRASDALGLARDDSWAPGEPGRVPFVAARDALPLGLTSDELGEDELTRLLSARGGELARVLESADRLRRHVCGDEVSYVVTRNIQYTNVCYFRCGFCAFSKGKLAANLRGAPYLVPFDEIVRRSQEAWERGATEVCLQGGIHPGVHGRLLRGRRGRDQGGGAGDPRARVLGARDLAGRGDARPRPRGVPRPAARPRPRLAPRHRRGGARRRGAPDHLPGQGHDRAVAGGARDRAPRRAPLERHAHVRPRRHAAELGAASPALARAAAGERGASRNSSRCRSCRWRRRCTCRGAPGAGRPSARRCSCTRSRGSRCTRGSRTSRPRG